MKEPPCLQIVSRNRLFRECLSELLSEGESRFAVREPSGRFQASVFREEPPDVFLIDRRQSRRKALAMVRELTRPPLRVRVLFLGAGKSPRRILECLEAGGHGYLPLEAAVEELREAVVRLLAGEVVFSPDITAAMFQRLAELAGERRRGQRRDFLELTAREMEIFWFLVDHWSNQEIATRLALSMHTVKNHVHQILKKLRVERRSELAQFAARRGWLESRR